MESGAGREIEVPVVRVLRRAGILLALAGAYFVCVTLGGSAFFIAADENEADSGSRNMPTEWSTGE